MQIGILYEGRYDEGPIISITKLILDEIGCTSNISFVTSDAGGNITPKMNAAAVLFFEGVEKCDLAIYISDTDYNPRKKIEISHWINNYCRGNADARIIVGCPQPHLEQWFLNDESAIRKTFSLPSGSLLPFPNEIIPKTRFTSIVEFLNHDLSKSKLELYSEVASYIDLPNLASRDTSFKTFYRDLKQALRTLCRTHTH